MELSEKAKKDLRNTIKNMGLKDTDFSEEDLNEIGMFLLTVLAESLKMKMKKQQR